jgi:phosphocarrier protein
MAQSTVSLVNRLGLHARAAAKFVHVTSRFSSQITVRYNEEEVNG